MHFSTEGKKPRVTKCSLLEDQAPDICTKIVSTFDVIFIVNVAFI